MNQEDLDLIRKDFWKMIECIGRIIAICIGVLVIGVNLYIAEYFGCTMMLEDIKALDIFKHMLEERNLFGKIQISILIIVCIPSIMIYLIYLACKKFIDLGKKKGDDL